MTMDNAAAARESARRKSDDFGEQAKGHPGTDNLTSGLTIVQDFDGQAVPPCMVQVELGQNVGGYPVSAGYLRFDAAPVLASMPLAERMRLVAGNVDDLYARACRKGLAADWSGPTEIHNASEVQNWIEHNSELQVAGNGWTEAWDDDENALVVSWSDRDAGDVGADVHIQTVREAGKFVALSDNATCPELRVVAVPAQLAML